MTPEIRLETFIAASALSMTCIGIGIIRAAIADFRKELEAVRAGQQLKTIDAEAPKQLE